MKKLIFTFFLALILISSPSAYAHLDGGEDVTLGGYLIDFGFSPEQPKITDKVTLAFNLVDDATKEIIEPTSVWIRISSPKDVIFAGTFHPEAKHVAFTYIFPEANNYEILVRFKENDKTLVETTFQLTVINSIQASVQSGSDSDGNIAFSPGYKLTFIFGIINIISLLLVFFSCRCLVGINFVKKMSKYKWYSKFYGIHCYYWWVLFISVFIHSLLAFYTFGSNF